MLPSLKLGYVPLLPPTLLLPRLWWKLVTNCYVVNVKYFCVHCWLQAISAAVTSHRGRCANVGWGFGVGHCTGTTCHNLLLYKSFFITSYVYRPQYAVSSPTKLRRDVNSLTYRLRSKISALCNVHRRETRLRGKVNDLLYRLNSMQLLTNQTEELLEAYKDIPLALG